MKRGTDVNPQRNLNVQRPAISNSDHLVAQLDGVSAWVVELVDDHVAGADLDRVFTGIDR